MSGASTRRTMVTQPQEEVVLSNQKVVAVTQHHCAKGAISWTIKKFSALSRTLKVGEKLISPEFTTGNKRWSLHIYPQGRREQWKDFIGVFLHYESDEPVIINFSITFPSYNLESNSGSLCSNNLKMEGHYKTGWDDFITRAELPDFLSRDDTLVVECEVEALFEWKASVQLDPLPGTEDPSLQQEALDDYHRLLDLTPQESFADFSFVVQGVTIPAHKAVLSVRSPVFRSMFQSGMVESRDGLVKLDDVEVPVFRSLLRFLYTGRVTEEILQSKCEELMALADKYDVQRLKERCETVLARAIGVDTVANILSVADTYHAATLKKAAITFVAQQFFEIVQTDAFKELCLKSPALVNEVHECFAAHHGRKRPPTARPTGEGSEVSASPSETKKSRPDA